MKHFKSPRQVQRFLSIHDQIAARFHSARNQAFTTWDEVTGLAMAA
jgi:putative transposase